LTIYRNNRPATRPQIHLIGATSDQASQHLTPDIRLTRNYVCTSHILRRPQKHHTSAIIRYHTSTLLKNSPGVKPRLEQPVDRSSLRSSRTSTHTTLCLCLRLSAHVHPPQQWWS